MKKQSKTWLLAILIINIAITSIHYTDNAIFVDDYPQPEWITTFGVVVSWLVMTAIAIMSYALYRRENFWFSYLLLGIYSITGLSSATHYFYGALSEFSRKMHLFIWTDVIAGLLIVAFIVWSALIIQEWRVTEEI